MWVWWVDAQCLLCQNLDGTQTPVSFVVFALYFRYKAKARPSKVETDSRRVVLSEALSKDAKGECPSVAGARFWLVVSGLQSRGQ
jgi:hypothetical protein